VPEGDDAHHPSPTQPTGNNKNPLQSVDTRRGLDVHIMIFACRGVA
jgi:hypothetical protein